MNEYRADHFINLCHPLAYSKNYFSNRNSILEWKFFFAPYGITPRYLFQCKIYTECYACILLSVTNTGCKSSILPFSISILSLLFRQSSLMESGVWYVLILLLKLTCYSIHYSYVYIKYIYIYILLSLWQSPWMAFLLALLQCCSLFPWLQSNLDGLA